MAVPAPQTSATSEAAKIDPPRPQVPPGSVSLVVKPWGEIYVNGKQRGLSPPLKTLKLAPGKYKIEVRNGDLPPHAETMEIKSREEVTLRHTFK